MICTIDAKNVVKVVIHHIQTARRKVYATHFINDSELPGPYEAAITSLQQKGVIFKRKIFTQKNTSFLRMLLIDDSILFFGIPKGKTYTFLMTTNSALINVYREYFNSLEKGNIIKFH